MLSSPARRPNPAEGVRRRPVQASMCHCLSHSTAIARVYQPPRGHPAHHPHLHAILLLRHTVRVRVGMALNEKLHVGAADALRRADGAVTVCEKQTLEVNDFFAELGDGLGEGVVFGGEELDFGLKVCEPLLFPLTTFEGGDAGVEVSITQLRIRRR